MQEDKILIGGLDNDSDENKVGSGDYTYALNIHNGIGAVQKFNIITNVLGNTLLTFALPAGISTTIGTYEAVQINAVIYFVYNSGGNHGIYIYRASNNTIEQLAQHNFGWLLNGEISGIDLVDGRLLYWVDNIQPRKLNIEKASLVGKRLSYRIIKPQAGASGMFTVNVFNQNGALQTTVAWDIATNIAPPSSFWTVDARSNFDAIITMNTVGWTIVNVTPFPADNAMLIRENHYSNLSYFHIAAYKVQPAHCVVGEYKYDPLVVFNNVRGKCYQFIMRYKFDDDEFSAWGTISKLVFNKFTAFGITPDGSSMTTGALPNPADLFPPLISPTYGNSIKNNYIELDLTSGLLFTPSFLNVVKKIELAFRVCDTESGEVGDFNSFRTIDIADFWKETATTNVLKARFYDNEITRVLSDEEQSKPFDLSPITAEAQAYIQNRIFYGGCKEGYDAPYVKAEIQPYSIQLGQTGTGPILINTTEAIFTIESLDREFYPVGTPFTLLGAYKGQSFEAFHKGGGKYRYGIVFYDKYGRFCPVATEKRLEFTVPYYPLAGPVVAGGGDNIYCYLYKLLLDPTSPIPDWAHYYQIVRTKNLHQSWYIQCPIEEVDSVEINSTTGATTIHAGPTINANASKVRFKLAPLEKYLLDNPSSFLEYTWAVGDRIKLYLANGTYDYAIGGPIDADGKFQFVPNIPQSDVQVANILTTYFPAAIKNGVFAEIYRLTQQDDVYKEVGMSFPILQPETPSRAFSQTTFELFCGDTYNRKRIFFFSNDPAPGFTRRNCFFETMNVDDFYPSQADDSGRVNTTLNEELKERQVNRISLIRFSNTFLQGGDINGLSTFDLASQKELDIMYGAVRKLQVVGQNIMLAIQEHKTNSMTIGERIYRDANGQDTVSTSTDVIGTIRPMEKNLGTQHPMTVQERHGMVFAWDQYQGELWKYDQNGQVVISDAYMKSTFDAIAKQFKSVPDLRIVAGFDTYHEEYQITFVSKRNNLFRTLVWSVPKSRWISERSYFPECYARTDQEMISFVNGQFWIHNQNATRNNFYGQQFSSLVRVKANKDPKEMKLWMNMIVQGGSLWFVPNCNNIYGQVSRILKARFKKQENVYAAEFLRDINTNKPAPILNGNPLRSEVLEITLQNDDTREARLFAVIVYTISSELTAK